MDHSEPKNASIQILGRLKERRAYLKFSKQYGQLGCKPNFFALIKVLSLTLPKKSDLFNFSTHKHIVREWRANRFPDDLRFNEKDLPTIEVLIVAAGKDIELLPAVIRAAIANTLNPISRITLIIPVSDQEQCKRVIQPAGVSSEVRIILEDDLLDEIARDKIKARFNGRYGWVLQQILSVEYILKSESSGVLLLDADTVIIQKVAWLDSNNNQKLMVGPAYHKPYHQFLNKIVKTDLVPKTNHVTHHMLIQPEFLREIFEEFSLIDTGNLVDQIVKYADEKEESAISVDYELYAQAMLKLHADKVELRKFANISVARSKVTDSLTLQTAYNNYNSVSMHSYLVADA
jgi:hypothetical protein